VEASTDSASAGSDGASQTADEILGLGTTSGTEVETQVEEQESVSTETETQEADLPVESAPEWMKPLFVNEDPKIASAAKSLWNRFQAYSQLGTAAEIRQRVEAIERLGGPEAIDELQRKSQEIDDVDNRWYSADPEQQSELLSSLQKDDPEAYATALQSGIELLKQNQPEVYSQFLGDTIRENFNAASNGHFEEHMQAMADAVRAGDKEALTDLAVRLAGWFGASREKLGFSASKKEHSLDPRELAMNRKLENFQQREQSFYGNQWKGFTDNISKQASNSAEKSAGEAIDRLMKAAGRRPNDFERGLLLEKISGDVEKSIRSDSGHAQRVARLIDPTGQAFDREGNLKDASKLRTDSQTLSQVMGLITAKQKQALPGVVKKYVDGWTGKVVAENNRTIEKGKNAASRADITGGVPRGIGGKKPLTPEMAQKMTKDQILDYDGPAVTA
jgi:hypothetical protein